MINAPVATEFARFEALRSQARAQDAGAYEAVAREFEAVFLNLLLKSARSTTFATGLLDSQQSRLYRELFDQQIALTMAERGDVGIAQTLAAQLQARYAPAEVPEAEPRGRTDSPAQPLSPVPPQAQVDSTRGATTRPAPALPAASAASPATPAWTADPFATHDDPRGRFLSALWPGVAALGREIGVPPEYIAAQAALETGWGRHVIRDASGQSSHNLFGIKAHAGWEGRRIEVNTTEFVQGVPVRQRAAFRAYPNLDSALADYRALLDTPRYRAALTQANGEGFSRALQRAGYATDPAYADKIIRIADQIRTLAPQTLAAGPAGGPEIW